MSPSDWYYSSNVWVSVLIVCGTDAPGFASRTNNGGGVRPEISLEYK